MRRIFIFSFVVLITTMSVFAQGKSIDAINNQIKSLNAQKSMEAMFIKNSNLTKVTALGADFGKDQDGANGMSYFNFGMAYFFPGSTMTAAPDSFTTTFWVYEKKPTFADSNGLTFVVDGETLDVGNARYARKNGDPREFLNYVVPRSVVEKIVKGKDVQLKIGKANFKFKPEHITLFNNLLAISSPS